MFLATAAIAAMAIVLYQQFIFQMPLRYTLFYWTSYFAILAVIFYLAPLSLPLLGITLVAIAICMAEVGLIAVSRHLERESERNPPGRGSLPEPHEHDERHYVSKAG